MNKWFYIALSIAVLFLLIDMQSLHNKIDAINYKLVNQIERIDNIYRFIPEEYVEYEDI